MLLLRVTMWHHTALELIWVCSRVELLLLRRHVSLWHVAIRSLWKVLSGVHGGQFDITSDVDAGFR